MISYIDELHAKINCLQDEVIEKNDYIKQLMEDMKEMQSKIWELEDQLLTERYKATYRKRANNYE